MLSDLKWSRGANPNVWVADVNNITGLQSDEELEFWKKKTNGKMKFPPAPDGWVAIPSHCIGDSTCHREHCDCANPPYQLARGTTKNETIDAAFKIASDACDRTHSCQSFSVRPGNYELFSLNNWSAVSNSDWLTYAKRGSRPTPPRPDPPSHKWGAPPALWNTLHVDGVRQIRARYPNGNPQDNSGLCFSKIQHPGEACDGYLGAKGQSGKNLPSSNVVAEVQYPNLDRNRAPLHPTDGGGSYGTFKQTIFDPPKGHPVYNKPMPGWNWSNNSFFSFWGDPMSRPEGVHYGTDIQKIYSNAGTGVVHMFHSGLWGGWQFQVSAQDVDGGSLQFSHGGYQEARGSGISKQHYFIENILEELDSPSEWFHDPATSHLYFWPNRTDGKVGEEIVAPILSTVIRLQNTSNIIFEGITFTETRATYLDQYEVPSGGDWSVHRGGTVEIIDSSNISISKCLFKQVGGNGVLLSNNVQNCSIVHNEFVYIGDSGIVVLGSAQGILGTQRTYPDGNLISNNHIHEFGIYGLHSIILICTKSHFFLYYLYKGSKQVAIFRVCQPTILSKIIYATTVLERVLIGMMALLVLIL